MYIAGSTLNTQLFVELNKWEDSDIKWVVT